MGTNYKLRNSNKIKKGFERLSERANSISEVIMRNAARDGLNKLIEAHEMALQLVGGNREFHLVENNTLAYALAHNGAIVESGYHNGGGERGGALGMAKEAVSNSAEGWKAAIVSDIQMGHYYLDDEEDLIHIAAESVRDELYGGPNSEYITPGAIPKPS